MDNGPVLSLNSWWANELGKGSQAVLILPAKLLGMHCAKTQGYELYTSISDRHTMQFLNHMGSFVQRPANDVQFKIKRIS